MNSIALFSIKGGTGKTTLSSSWEWIFAEQAHRVLMIDMDAQGHLTQLFTCKNYKYSFDVIWVLINKINNHRPLDRENG